MTDTAAPIDVPRRGRAPLNPVLARELRVRLRGGRAWILLTAYLLILGTILFLVYQAESGSGADPFQAASPTRFATVGRSIFEWLVFFMLLLVLFLVPGFTSGAIAGERERQTLVPLQVTLLRPWQVVVGKLGASFAFLALLVVATAPLLSVAYLIGGVTIGTVLRGIAVVLFSGVTLACITVCCSAIFRRVQTATVIAYAIVLILTLGTLLVWEAAGIVDRSRGSDPKNPPAYLLALNPLFTAADVLDDGESVADQFGIGPSSPFSAMQSRLLESQYGSVQGPVSGFGPEVFVDRGFAGGGFVGGFDPSGAGPLGFGPNGRPIVGFDDDGNPVEATDSGFPFWSLSVIALYGTAVVGILIAAARLRTPTAVER